MRSTVGTTLRHCCFCGGSITFRKLPNGKSQPCEPDGSDHWDTCKRRQRIASGLLSSDGTVNLARTSRAKPPGKTATSATHVYCGDKSPWDASLGAFRDFTAQEKQVGMICQPV